MICPGANRFLRVSSPFQLPKSGHWEWNDLGAQAKRVWRDLNPRPLPSKSLTPFRGRKYDESSMENDRILRGRGLNAVFLAGLRAVQCVLASCHRDDDFCQKGRPHTRRGQVTTSAGLVALLLMMGAAAVNAQQVDMRIARIEAGLLPPILWKGEPRVGQPLKDRMVQIQVPGVSVAVVDNFAPAWARGWGVVRAGDAGVVTSDTLFQAGSASKTVAALLALRLVSRGRIGLDDPVNTRLTSWKLPDSSAGGEQAVTIRHLLSHSAGLTPVTYPALDPGNEIPTALQLLQANGKYSSFAIARVEPPGKRFAYSNAAYVILQQLLADVSGKAFNDLARAELFEPLGMTNSSFAPVPPAALLDRAAWGHGAGQQPAAFKGGIVPAAVGGLWTTPSDLVRLLAAFLRSFRGDADGLLPQELAHEALTTQVGSQSLVAPVEGQGSNLRMFQLGAMPGFVAYLVGYPELGRGAAVMVNAGGRSGELVREIARAIATEYDWPDYIREYERAMRPPDTLAAFGGQYEFDSPPGFKIEISVKDGRLFWGDREMVAVVGGTFVVPTAGGEVEFIRDAAGTIVGLDYGPPGARRARARRIN